VKIGWGEIHRSHFDASGELKDEGKFMTLAMFFGFVVSGLGALSWGALALVDTSWVRWILVSFSLVSLSCSLAFLWLVISIFKAWRKCEHTPCS